MTFYFVPQASITRPIAKQLGVDYALANKLVGVYNKYLYVDAPMKTKIGNRSSQIILGTLYPKLAHLADIRHDDKHLAHAEWLLAAAGFLRSSNADPIIVAMLNQKPGDGDED